MRPQRGIGKHNRILAEVRKAIRMGTVTAGGLLPIEGPKLLHEAFRSGRTIPHVFTLDGARLPPIECGALHTVSRQLFKTIQATETSQGVVALVRPPQFEVDDLLRGGSPIVVVLDKLQDPGNVGTILRIAEAFRASGCLALKGSASFFNPKAVRASAGSLFRVPWVQGLQTDSLAALKRKGLQLVATSSRAESAIDQWDWTKPCAIVLGNEGSGLGPGVQRICDTVLRIPQDPVVESLNAAIASAVILYEVWKQRTVAGTIHQ